MSKGFKAWFSFVTITNLIYSKGEVHCPISFSNGSPLAKTALDINFILVGGE